MSNLEPCPFCGSEVKMLEFKHSELYAICCNNCLIETRLYSDPGRLEVLWNRRAEVKGDD